jgi:hypothetical protein
VEYLCAQRLPPRVELLFSNSKIFPGVSCEATKEVLFYQRLSGMLTHTMTLALLGISALAKFFPDVSYKATKGVLFYQRLSGILTHPKTPAWTGITALATFFNRKFFSRRVPQGYQLGPFLSRQSRTHAF